MAAGGDGYYNFRDKGYNRMDFGINMENALINYLNQTSPYTPASRDSLLACIGKDRYTILEAWPKDAQHCRILESSGASVILACDEGKYRHVYINGTQECRPCQAGAFSANFSTETACVPCPPGPSHMLQFVFSLSMPKF
eukprot:gene18211-21695_t